MAAPCTWAVNCASVHTRRHSKDAPVDAGDHTRGHDDDVRSDSRPRGELHPRLCALATTDASYPAPQVGVHLKLGGRPSVRASAALRQLLLPARPHGCILAAALRDPSASFHALAAGGGDALVVMGLHVCGGVQDAEQEGALWQVTEHSQTCMPRG